MGRYALLIGNREYQDGKLQKLALPEANVASLELVLTDKSIGAFDEVKTLVDPHWYEVQPIITKFFKNRVRDDFLVIFFAGHGVKNGDGHLYLAFKDTDPDDLEGTAIPNSFVASQMARSPAESQLLILDCCYSGAFGPDTQTGLGTLVGIREVYSNVFDDISGVGRMILTAANTIQYTWEGKEIFGIKTNSIFTKAIIQGIREGLADLDGNGVITIDELYQYLYQTIRSANSDQEPQLLTHSSRHWGELVIALSPKCASFYAGDELPEAINQALESDNPAMRQSAIDELERFLENHTLINKIRSALQVLLLHDGEHTTRLKALSLLHKVSEVESLMSGNNAEKQNDKENHSLATVKTQIAVQDILPGPFEWCKIPHGYIEMDESTLISFQVEPFLMAKYPITYAQFRVFLEARDGYFNEEWWQGLACQHTQPGLQNWPEDNLPRENVSWYDAVAFCRWLSAQLNYEIRLPMEWEWEWAAGGHERRSYPWGNIFDETRCNTKEGGIGKTAPVDAYPEGASPFGVLNMSGNIWERCANSFFDLRHVTVYGSSFRGLRGGSWRYTQDFARVADRLKCVPEKRFDDGGFRIVTVY